jgi:uncharacterized membrane protein YphA (DoxX/SURF4 family)
VSGGGRRPAAWAGGHGRGWGGSRFRSPLSGQEGARPASPGAPDSPERSGGTAPVPAGPAPAAGGIRGAAARAEEITAQWAPTAARILLGLVLAWFGYHELLLPGEWTGYVPVISATSDLAVIAVLVHGWVLLVLAAALVAGIAPRLSAAIAAVLLAEIVISLAVAGVSDTTARDAGVLGLAICLAGSRGQRLVLRD